MCSGPLLFTYGMIVNVTFRPGSSVYPLPEKYRSEYGHYMTHDDLERESLHSDSPLAKWAAKSVSSANQEIADDYFSNMDNAPKIIPMWLEDGTELFLDDLNNFQQSQAIRATLEGCSGVVFKQDETFKEPSVLVSSVSSSSSYLENLCREYDYTNSMCSVLLSNIRKYAYARTKASNTGTSEIGMVKTCYVGRI